MYPSFHAAVHHAAFSVSSVITTTGFCTENFDLWPEFSRVILAFLMIVGASAGSTGGGLKVSASGDFNPRGAGRGAQTHSSAHGEGHAHRRQGRRAGYGPGGERVFHFVRAHQPAVDSSGVARTASTARPRSQPCLQRSITSVPVWDWRDLSETLPCSARCPKLFCASTCSSADWKSTRC